MKTVKQVLDEIVVKNQTSMETDTIEKIIYLAYSIGLERGTSRTSNAYNAVLKEQIDRAHACRYHNMAMEIQGNRKYVYNPDYGNMMEEMFGNDKTALFDKGGQ